MSKDFWDNSAQDARIRRVSRMIPDQATLTITNIGDIIHAVERYLNEFGVTRQQLARAIGTNEAYISELLGRSRNLPIATRDKLLRQINNWMEEDLRSRAARRPEDFVETSAARLIIEAARHIKAARTIGVVDGPAGLGKTITAKWLAGEGDSELPGTMLVTVDHDCHAARGLLVKIYAASKLRRAVRRRPTLADVVGRLKGSGRLLIIDQAQDLLNAAAFKLLQDLHDACDLPILLLGTVAVHHYLTDDEDPQYGQLSSRIGLRVHLMSELFRTGQGGRRLQWLSVAELRRIFDGGKLKLHPDTLRALAQIANFEVGHLRRVKWLVRYAAAAARAAKARAILPDHLGTALKLVKGERCRVVVPAEAPATQEARG